MKNEVFVVTIAGPPACAPASPDQLWPYPAAHCLVTAEPGGGAPVPPPLGLAPFTPGYDSPPPDYGPRLPNGYGLLLPDGYGVLLPDGCGAVLVGGAGADGSSPLLVHVPGRDGYSPVLVSCAGSSGVPSPPSSYSGCSPPPALLLPTESSTLQAPLTWVRPRIGPVSVADPRTLAEVHEAGFVRAWKKSLRLENALVAIHVRHESFTVEPAFPGPINRHCVTDPAGVLHVCVPITQFQSQVEYGMYVVWVTCFAELFSQTGQHWALVPQVPSTPKPSPIWRSFSTSAKIRFRCDKCNNAWTSMHGQVTFHYFLHRGPGAGTVFFQLFGQKCRVCVRRRQNERAAAAAGAAPEPAEAPAAAQTAEPEGAAAAEPVGATAAEPMGAAAAGPRGIAAVEPRGVAAAEPKGAAAAEPRGAAAAEPMGAAAAEPRGAAAVALPRLAAEPENDADVEYQNPMWYPDEVRRVLHELFSQVTSKVYPEMPRMVAPAGQQRRFGRPQQSHNPALCQGCAAGTCRMLKRR